VTLLSALRAWWSRDRRPLWQRLGYETAEEAELILARKREVWTSHRQWVQSLTERDPAQRSHRLDSWRTKWASDAAAQADGPAPLVAFDAREHPPSYPPTQWITGPSGPTLIPADDKET
jgi:hypothetical protein